MPLQRLTNCWWEDEIPAQPVGAGASGTAPVFNQFLDWFCCLNEEAVETRMVIRMQASWRFRAAVVETSYKGERRLGGDDVRPHGKGKLTWADNYWYEGDFAYGVAHGRGKMVFPDGRVYEGQWWYGGRVRGKQTDATGSVYDGQWSGAFKHGVGLLLAKPSGHRLWGEWQRDQLHGRAVETVFGPEGAFDNEYDGQFVRGVRHGTGAERVGCGLYTGQWVDGVREGEGLFESDTGDDYTGGWARGKRNGEGVFTTSSGSMMKGVWVDDNLPRGESSSKYGGSYIGEFQGLLRHGYGEWHGRNKQSYVGQWEGDYFCGEGEYRVGAAIYNGQFRTGKRHGKGRWVAANGDRYDGSFDKDQFHGHGVHAAFADGRIYNGQWQNGKRHGEGTFSSVAAVRYVGQWAFGKRHGQGREYHPDGSMYLGLWEADERCGEGTWQEATGEVVYEGEYAAGLRHGNGKWNGLHGDGYAGSFNGGTMSGPGHFEWSGGDEFEGVWIQGSREHETYGGCHMPHSMMRGGHETLASKDAGGNMVGLISPPGKKKS